MRIMKFGGSSLGTGQRMMHAASLVKKFSNNEDVVVVVSAMHKVTDKLISLFQKYKLGQFSDAFEEMRVLYRIHKQALEDLKLQKKNYVRVDNALLNLFGNLSMQLTLNKEYKLNHYDFVISFGERFSSCLLAAALNEVGLAAKSVSAAQVIVADGVFGNAKALLGETELQAKKSLSPLLSQKVIPVVTGFFAATKNGETITFGRGGSDYSAAILANVLDAKEVILWKEVDGVFSGDPKNDAEAIFYSELSYAKALSLAENGAKILHPEAMKPVALKGIIVRVKNTFRPDFAGTKIFGGQI